MFKTILFLARIAVVASMLVVALLMATAPAAFASVGAGATATKHNTLSMATTPAASPNISPAQKFYSDAVVGLCIGIAPGQKYAGAWSCNNNSDQMWHAGSCNADHYCEWVNGNNQCLGVDGASTQEEARITAWTCNTNNDQYWIRIYCTKDFYLVNYQVNPQLNQHLVIGILAPIQNGAKLIQWQSNGHLDQCWRLAF